MDQDRTRYKKFKNIPVYIVEDHNDVLEFIYRCIGSRHLPLKENVIIHFDSHPDLLIPQNLQASVAKSGKDVLAELSIENWILPACYAGFLNSILWVKPPWAHQIKEGQREFFIGEARDSGTIRVDCTESYFLSDGLYMPTTDLTNVNKLTLTVLGLDHTKTDNENNEINVLDFVKKPYILDIDLDFFSTKNPFKDLYEKVSAYEQLKEIYRYSKPACMEEAADYAKLRENQLSHLKSIFEHLEKFRSLESWGGSQDNAFQQVKTLAESIIANYPEVNHDWLLVHDAGCTCDDTDLPHHVSTRSEILVILEKSFTPFLDQLLSAPPTIITIARSSLDDYCPPDDVDFIQEHVIDILKSKFKIDVPILKYKEM